MISVLLAFASILSTSLSTLYAPRTPGMVKDRNVKFRPDDICLEEKSVDWHDSSNLKMAETAGFAGDTFEECAKFCLTKTPEFSYVLLSYYDSIWSRKKYNCICANEVALRNSTLPSSLQCDQDCPRDLSGNTVYRCGNAKSDFLSGYCLNFACLPGPQNPICSRKLPHDSHGCVKHDFVTWRHVVHMQNFTSHDTAACVWACRKDSWSARARFALSRILPIGNDNSVLACSCVRAGAFNLDRLVSPEFCQLVNKPDTDYYRVDCVTDLDENRPHLGDQANCSDPFAPVGCIFEDIASGEEIVAGQRQNSPSEIDPFECSRLCAAAESEANFFAVRLDISSRRLFCRCIDGEDFSPEFQGPRVVCNQTCGPAGSGLSCGSPARARAPAMSVYCQNAWNNATIHELGELTVEEFTLMEKVAGENTTSAEVLVGLLAVVLVVVSSLIVYLCYTRGIVVLLRHSA